MISTTNQLSVITDDWLDSALILTGDSRLFESYLPQPPASGSFQSSISSLHLFQPRPCFFALAFALAFAFTSAFTSAFAAAFFAAAFTAALAVVLFAFAVLVAAAGFFVQPPPPPRHRNLLGCASWTLTWNLSFLAHPRHRPYPFCFFVYLVLCVLVLRVFFAFFLSVSSLSDSFNSCSIAGLGS